MTKKKSLQIQPGDIVCPVMPLRKSYVELDRNGAEYDHGNNGFVPTDKFTVIKVTESLLDCELISERKYLHVAFSPNEVELVSKKEPNKFPEPSIVVTVNQKPVDDKKKVYTALDLQKASLAVSGDAFKRGTEESKVLVSKAASEGLATGAFSSFALLAGVILVCAGCLLPSTKLYFDYPKGTPLIVLGVGVLLLMYFGIMKFGKKYDYSSMKENDMESVL